MSGSAIYFKLKDKVIDGTPCNHETTDICVDGKCMVGVGVQTFLLQNTATWQSNVTLERLTYNKMSHGLLKNVGQFVTFKPSLVLLITAPITSFVFLSDCVCMLYYSSNILTLNCVISWKELKLYQPQYWAHFKTLWCTIQECFAVTFVLDFFVMYVILYLFIFFKFSACGVWQSAKLK